MKTANLPVLNLAICPTEIYLTALGETRNFATEIILKQA